MESQIYRFFYRSNDLFEVLVPKIVAMIEKVGHTVKLFVAPNGTNDKETKHLIYEWWKKEAFPEDRMIQLGNVFTDTTCAAIIPTEQEWGGQLDRMTNRCVVAAFMGMDQVSDNLRQSEKSMEESKKVFQVAIRYVAEKIGSPSVVQIETKSLNDHGPFISPVGVKMDLLEVLPILQSWIWEVFPDCNFEDINSEATCWHIADRHTRVKPTYSTDSGGHHYLRFRLPVEDMLMDLAGLGLLPQLSAITDQMIADIGENLLWFKPTKK